MVETLEGLPVRTLETDEFGIVPLCLAGRNYNPVFIEDGIPRPALRLAVDTNPFVLQIRR